MARPRRQLVRLRPAVLGVAITLLAAAGCGGGQQATPESVQAARQLWARAGLRDYDLDWSVSGSNNAHYQVTVRGGEVKKVESLQQDGSKVPLHPEKMQFYGVDGLFKTIDEELAICGKQEKPFGQPKGTKVIMRFRPDDRLGYPHWYHRDLLGTKASMAIDVKSLTPVTPGAGADRQ